MHVVVLGAGGLGSLVGGLLARAHEVTLVGREPHVGAVRESGLELVGAVTEHRRPAARTDPPATAALTLVTVKSYDTPAAADAVAGMADPGVVCSLQNGVGNEATLAERAGPVLAGTTDYGAELVEPGVVRCNGVGTVTLGPREGGHSEAADRAGAAVEAAGVKATVAPDMPRRLWEKLAVNAGINPVTALTGRPNGAVLKAPLAGVAEAAARETARVARATGLDLADGTAVEALRSVAAATAENVSSMRQDIEAGRRTEVAAINGAVVDAAAEEGVSAPVNETLTGLVRGR